jgi:hypothetical protein
MNRIEMNWVLLAVSAKQLKKAQARQDRMNQGYLLIPLILLRSPRCTIPIRLPYPDLILPSELAKLV